MTSSTYKEYAKHVGKLVWLQVKYWKKGGATEKMYACALVKALKKRGGWYAYEMQYLENDPEGEEIFTSHWWYAREMFRNNKFYWVDAVPERPQIEPGWRDPPRVGASAFIGY